MCGQFFDYRIARMFGGRKFGEFGEFSVLCQTLISQIYLINGIYFLPNVLNLIWQFASKNGSKFARKHLEGFCWAGHICILFKLALYFSTLADAITIAFNSDTKFWKP